MKRIVKSALLISTAFLGWSEVGNNVLAADRSALLGDLQKGTALKRSTRNKQAEAGGEEEKAEAGGKKAGSVAAIIAATQGEKPAKKEAKPAELNAAIQAACDHCAQSIVAQLPTALPQISSNQLIKEIQDISFKMLKRIHKDSIASQLSRQIETIFQEERTREGKPIPLKTSKLIQDAVRLGFKSFIEGRENKKEKGAPTNEEKEKGALTDEEVEDFAAKIRAEAFKTFRYAANKENVLTKEETALPEYLKTAISDTIRKEMNTIISEAVPSEVWNTYVSKNITQKTPAFTTFQKNAQTGDALITEIQGEISKEFQKQFNAPFSPDLVTEIQTAIRKALTKFSLVMLEDYKQKAGEHVLEKISALLEEKHFNLLTQPVPSQQEVIKIIEESCQTIMNEKLVSTVEKVNHKPWVAGAKKAALGKAEALKIEDLSGTEGEKVEKALLAADPAHYSAAIANQAGTIYNESEGDVKKKIQIVTTKIARIIAPDPGKPILAVQEEIKLKPILNNAGMTK